jgi:hypothetical protein
MGRMRGCLVESISLAIVLLHFITPAPAFATPDEEECPTCDPTCQERGHLVLDPGPVVTVSNLNPIYGETVTLTIVSVHDTGGTKQVCDSEGNPVLETIPAASIRYSYRIIAPNGVKTEGAGQSAHVLINRCGVWDVQFFAEPERDCKPFGTPGLDGGLAHGTYIGGSSVRYPASGPGYVPCPSPATFTISSVAARIAAARSCLEGKGIDVDRLLAGLQRFVNPSGPEMMCICVTCPATNCAEWISPGLFGIDVNRNTMEYCNSNNCQTCDLEATFIHELLHDYFGDNNEEKVCGGSGHTNPISCLGCDCP